MSPEFKDGLLERFGLLRRFYGLKLLFTVGKTDATNWFLHDRHELKYSLDLAEEGIVIDIGAYKGNFTLNLLRKNPKLTFLLYEPILEYYNVAKDKLGHQRNVIINQKGVSSDGRKIQLLDEGLRSRQIVSPNNENLEIHTHSILAIFEIDSRIELLKMNIEGMEYECLEILIKNDKLKLAKNLLIQFHNFENTSEDRYMAIRDKLNVEYDCVFSYKWIWELWKRKTEISTM
jgi:FkbM family methyltransferase